MRSSVVIVRMPKLNATWHDTHRMPRNATLEQRITWHVAHAQACGCRAIPPTIRKALSARGMSVATRTDG